MTTLKLYHKDSLIGTITNPVAEETFEMSGIVSLTPAGEALKPVFAVISEGIMEGEELPFDESYLGEWYIEGEGGERKLVLLPAIQDDGVIYWRE